METIKRSKKKGNSSQYVHMDEDVFKEHVKMLKWKYGKTVREIEKYTVKTIHRSAKEIDQERLKETDNAVRKCLVEVKKVCFQLNENLDEEKLDVVDKFRHDIIQMHVENEVEIKRRFSKLQDSRSKPNIVENKKQIQRISIIEEKSV